MVRIAVLDDYQNVALELADWSPLADQATLTVFNDHVSDPNRSLTGLHPSMRFVSCASELRFLAKSSRVCPNSS